MNPLVRRYVGNDETIEWTQSATLIGSFDRDTRFRVGVSGGVFVAQNTAPPYESQTNLYSQTMLTPTAGFFGASDAVIAQYIADNYEWQFRNLSSISVSGSSAFAHGTWYPFNASGLDSVPLTIDEPMVSEPSYTFYIREKATGTQVAMFGYQIDLP